MKAFEIMTRKPISVTPETTIIEAAQLMLGHHFSGLPVTDAKGSVVGIVTEGDLLRRIETGTERHRPRWLELLVGPGRLAHDYADSHARKVGEVMTSEVAWVAPEEPLEGVVKLMEKRGIKRVPVVEANRLVGIVSRADLVHALVSGLKQEAEAAATAPLSDADIRKNILAIIDKEPWGPRFSIDVSVDNGVVHLNGTVTDDRERTALTVAAETVPGIKSVHDHLLWVEPTSGFVISAEDERA